MKGSSPDDSSPRVQAAVQSMFADLPAEMPARAEALNRLRDGFLRALAGSLQDTLNQHIAGQPQQTLEDKNRVAIMVNSTLRGLGLTIECPKTQRPAILVVDTQGTRNDTTARFRFQVRDDEGHAIRTGSCRHELPSLTLIPDHPRKEFWTRRRRDSGLDR